MRLHINRAIIMYDSNGERKIKTQNRFQKGF